MARGGGIKRISSLFEVYTKRLHAPERTVVNGFCDAVRQQTDIELKKDWVRYSPASRTLMLEAPGPIKTEILLQKSAIMERMSDTLGPKNTPHTIL